MLPDRMLEPDSLRASRGRVSISLRMPWYRALPLSSVANVGLVIDDIQVPTDSLIWGTASGERYRLDELPPLWQSWWFVLDSVVLEGELPVLPDIEDHEVELTVGLYIPYVPSPEGAPLVIEKAAQTMKLVISE
jgi:hypothetical protein